MIKEFIKKHYVLLLAIAGYLLISTPLHLSGNHILFNLEPYPDSFGYLTPVHNLLNGNGFTYSFQGHEIIQRMPPLYSVVLIPLYAVLKTPVSFYFTNQVLGVLSLMGLSFLIKEVTEKKQKVYETIALLLYLTHSLIFLLAATPMAENLILPLLIWSTYFFYKKKLSKKEVIISGALITGLLLTKYVYAMVAITFGLLFLYRFYKTKEYRKLAYIILSSAFMLFLLFGYLYSLNWSSFTFVADFKSFSTSYITQGFKFYSDAILGRQSRFLWYSASLTSGLFIISTALAIVITLRNKTKLIPAVILYLSHFAMVVPYFYLDTRFVISLVPLSIMIFILLIKELKVSNQIIFFATIILLSSLFLSQFNLYKQIIGQNILGNSTAWQYEAVQSLGTFMKDHEGVLVTALHPPLFSLYGYDDISLLPISEKQEFHADYIWGDIDTDLHTEIRNRLKDEQDVYISNAYITAIPVYTTSFESFKQNFELELVSTGCMEACNIYRVEKKPNL